MFLVIGFYWTNHSNTSYLPLLSNKTFDNRGKRYNVSRVLNDKFMFDAEKYQKYSQPYMSAGNSTNYLWSMSMYTCGKYPSVISTRSPLT